jgi:hypothetical protein
MQIGITPLNSINHSIFVMVKCGVFFAVRTEFLNIIHTSFGFKELKKCIYFILLHSNYSVPG